MQKGNTNINGKLKTIKNKKLAKQLLDNSTAEGQNLTARGNKTNKLHMKSINEQL